MKKKVEISKKEASAIMVGMAEFEAITYEKEIFSCYRDITHELVEKFRKLVWEFHYDEKENKHE